MSEQWMRPSLKGLSLYYNPEIEEKVRMDTSTNLLGANPVAEEVLEDCKKMDLNQYPRPYSDDLRKALADFYSLSLDHFVAGNGSDEILDIIFKSFMDYGERIVMPYPTYSLHDYFVRINGGTWELVDLDQDYQLRVDEMLDTEGKMLILCTPNNPTANSFRKGDVERLVREWEGPVVVDEAYGEFSECSFIPLVDEYRNLIVTRTFSKAYGLAGMRIGYSVAHPDLTSIMLRVRIPYSLDRVSERMAIAALKNRDYVEEIVSVVNRERDRLKEGLEFMGFHTYPSSTNFMMARSPVPSGELTSRLEEKGVLIRDFGDKRGLENCVRTTIGTPELNSLLLEKIEEVLSEWE